MLYLMVKTKTFFLWSTIRSGGLLPPLLFTIVPEILARAIRQDVKNQIAALTGVAQLASSHKAKSHQFDSWSEHMPGLRAWSLVGTHARGSCPHQCICFSHIHVSLTHWCFSPLSPSLPRLKIIKSLKKKPRTIIQSYSNQDNVVTTLAKYHSLKTELTKCRIILGRNVKHGRYFLTEMEKDFRCSSSSEVFSKIEKEVAQAIKNAIIVTTVGIRRSSFNRRGSIL